MISLSKIGHAIRNPGTHSSSISDLYIYRILLLDKYFNSIIKSCRNDGNVTNVCIMYSLSEYIFHGPLIRGLISN